MTTNTTPFETEKRAVEQLREARTRISRELSKVMVGQQEVVEQLLISLFAGGHCLITGAPGLAKTLLVRSLAQIFHLKFQRIQFTPDLMPADITGTNILVEEGGQRIFRFQAGPIFANLVLADEINRATPKTQSSLLEAMQEHQVTVARQRYRGTGITWEREDAKVPHYRAIFDDKRRIMVMICHNTDNGDGWEREGEDEWYFREFSEKKAYPVGINIVFYAMTH